MTHILFVAYVQLHVTIPAPIYTPKAIHSINWLMV